MGMQKKAVSDAKVVLQKCERCGDTVPILFLSSDGDTKICFRCQQLEKIPSGEVS